MGRSPPLETQFVTEEGEELFDAIEILDEKPGKLGRQGYFLVRWDGVDPETGEDWQPTWEPKSGCTDDLIQDWKAKKKADPSIVGRWTKKEEEKKKEARRKAKEEQEEKKAKASKKGKETEVREVSGDKRKRTSSGQDGRSTSSKKVKTSPGKPISVASSSASASTSHRAEPPAHKEKKLGKNKKLSLASIDDTEDDPSPVEDFDATDEEDWSKLGSSRHVNKAGAGQPKQKASAASPKNRKGKSKTVDDETYHESVASQEEDDASVLTPPAKPVTKRRLGRDPKSTSITSIASVKGNAPASKKGKQTGTVDKAPASIITPIDESSLSVEAEEDDAAGPAANTVNGEDATKSASAIDAGVNSMPSPPATPEEDTRIHSKDSTKNKDNTASPAPKGKKGKTTVTKNLSKDVIPPKKTLGPVPDLPATLFKKSNEQSENPSQPDKSISMSQLDPISQFSSSLPGDTQAEDGKTVETANKDLVVDLDDDLDALNSQDGSSPTKDVVGLEDIMTGDAADVMHVEVSISEADLDGHSVTEEGSAVLPRETQGNGTQASLEEGEIRDDGRKDIARSNSTAPVASDDDTTKADLAILRKAVRALQEEITQLPSKEAFNELSAAVQAKDEEIVKLTAEISKAQVDSARASDQLSSQAEELLAEKDRKIAALTFEVDEAKRAPSSTTHAAEIEALKADLQEKHKQVELALTTIGERDKVIEDLQSALTEIKEAKRSIQEHSDFLRDQYDTASQRAVEEVKRSRKLQQEVEILRGQLETAPKQRSMHFEAINKKREEENKKLRLQAKFLLDQARLTDDVVRAKAAMAVKYERENAKLREIEQKWELKYSELQLRNEELAEQRTMLLAQQMGVLGDSDDSDSEGDAEDDITDDERSPVLRSTRQTIPARQAARPKPNAVEESLGFSASQIMPAESQFAGNLDPTDLDVFGDPSRSKASGVGANARAANLEAESVVDGGIGFVCKWNDGTEGCTFMFDTRAASRYGPCGRRWADRQGLAEHVRDHTSQDNSNKG